MNLLAGDLGGTKTLLAIYSSKNQPAKLHYKAYVSKDWPSFNLILENFYQQIPKIITPPEYGCIAIAGQVTGNICRVTNLQWDLNSHKLAEIAKLKQIELTNDISALIYGIPKIERCKVNVIQEGEQGEINLNESIAVIGAGTGLGMARGIKTAHGIKALPSEGGHREFAARTEKEWEISEWLKKDLNLDRLSTERIVSGTGLGNIARWRLLQPDASHHPLRNYLTNQGSYISKTIDFPSLVSQFANKNDSLMSEVLNIWLGAYGSAAGDLALQELCSAGLWIAGGASAKNLKGISSMTFLNAFRNKGRFSSYLTKIPIKLLLDQETTLFSSACRAHTIAESSGRLS